MALEGRTPKACYEPFRKHVSKLIACTLGTNEAVFQIASARPRYMFQIVPSGSMIPLKTQFGRLHLHIAQTLEAEQLGRNRFRLRTRSYWYRLHNGPNGNSRALIRWEYDSYQLKKRESRPARNHVQLPAKVQVNDETELDLNKLHVPTGWVLIEEVIRFAIADLGVVPLCGDEWPEILVEGERKFREIFT